MSYYSPQALKALFGVTKVNPILNFDIDELRNVGKNFTKKIWTKLKKNLILHKTHP